MHFAHVSAAVHLCWLTAHLYEQQIFTLLFQSHKHAVSLFCRATLDQWGMPFALSNAAECWCWLTAHLYEQQTFTGVFPVPPACCEPILQSSTEQ